MSTPNLRAAATGPVDTAAIVEPVIEALDRIIVGKTAQLRLCVACLLARGHLLIEDLPGVGKTTLAHALASSLGLRYQRIQFTSDLLPADVIGVSVFSRETRPAWVRSWDSLLEQASALHSGSGYVTAFKTITA